MDKLHHALCALFCFCIAAAAHAQQAPQVWVPPAPSQQPITLDEVSIDVQMRGFLATSRIKMTFANPNNRVLEGEFVFPLGANQTLSGYALEVNGAMRQGVVVPRETARVAFEETVRAQIDPGLAELTRGNVFRTRLYPIPANGKKRIALTIEQTLDDAGSHWRYLLPLHFTAPVKTFSVLAQAPLENEKPALASDSPDVELQFTQAATVWQAQFTRENIQPAKELSFRIPKQASEATVLEAPDALEPSQRAVLARIDTGLPANLSSPLPSRIAIFFDASGSAADRDLAREREALKAYFSHFSEVDVELVVFRDVAQAPQRFTLRNGQSQELLAALEALPLDGASNYSAINFSATPRAQLALVLGDGLDTFGSGQADISKAPARLVVLHASQRADHARLDMLARQGGGAVLDLTRMDAAQADKALRAPGWKLLSVESKGPCDVVSPVVRQTVQSTLTLAARCNGAAVVSLVFGTGNGGENITRTLAIGQKEAAKGDIAKAVWRAFAQTQIAQLETAATPDVDAITQLAVKHGVVTSQTSLLVLDRIEDYVRYGVEPMEADLAAEYRKQRAAMPKPQGDIGRDARLADLSARWKEFRDWHGQRHPWLETLLAPAAAEELSAWKHLEGHADATTRAAALTASKQAQTIDNESRKLAERWAEDGAEASKRVEWEKQAIAVMLRLDALRTQRLELAPESAQWKDERREERQQMGGAANETMAMAMPAPPPAPPPSMAAPVAEAEASLDSVMVSGSAAPPMRAAPKSVESAPAMKASITLIGWNPDTPTLKQLRAASDAYAAYLELRTEHKDSPSFFLDAADFFREEAKQPDLALRVLTNLAEMGFDNTALLRVLGYRLSQWNLPELALRPLEDALAQRPEEPQSHRDLALVLSRLSQPQTARAIELLWFVATHDWHGRFPDIDLIALHELNALFAAAKTPPEIGELRIPENFLTPLKTDLRVVLTWDADNTDIDLWVIDPTGEAVYYSRPRSRSGGHISRDFTGGYGPEAFTIARPLPGTYRVQAHYFGDRRQTLTGPVTVQLEFFTGFGSENPQRIATTRRLESGKQRIDVGSFTVKP